jgi:hypothetical protein
MKILVVSLVLVSSCVCQTTNILSNGWLSGNSVPSSCRSGVSPTFYDWSTYRVYDCLNDNYSLRSSGGSTVANTAAILKGDGAGNAIAATSANVASLWAGGLCAAGYMKGNGTCDAGTAQVFPGVGVANSTGAAWGPSYTVGTGASNLVQLDGAGRLPGVSAALLTNFPTFNQNTTGTAAGLTAQYIDWNAAPGTANSIANKPTVPTVAVTASVLKGNGAGGAIAATSGVDFAPPSNGLAILKGNGLGGFASATSGSDYAPATPAGTAILKSNGVGGFSGAVSSVDYAPSVPLTLGLLAGNNAGGFNVATPNVQYALPGADQIKVLNDFTGQKSLGGVYNNVGGPIFVSVIVTCPAGQGAQILLGPTNPPTLIVAQQNAGSGVQSTYTMNSFVVNNQYFKVTAGAGCTVFRWFEFSTF